MGDIRDRYRRLLTRGEGLERLVFYSDAVFAIAMTLLVIDIRLPEGEPGVPFGELLAETVPEIIAYVISFMVIALNWIAHHRKFSVTRSYDSRLIWLNFLLLLLIAFLPFPTSLLFSGEASASPVEAVVLYAAVVAAISLVQLAMWVYAYRAGHIDHSRVDEEVFRYAAVNIAVTPAVFLVSIPIALIAGAEWGEYSWLLLAPASIIAPRIERRGRGSVEVETELPQE